MKLKMNCIHKCYLRLRLTPVTECWCGASQSRTSKLGPLVCPGAFSAFRTMWRGLFNRIPATARSSCSVAATVPASCIWGTMSAPILNEIMWMKLKFKKTYPQLFDDAYWLCKNKNLSTSSLYKNEVLTCPMTPEGSLEVAELFEKR